MADTADGVRSWSRRAGAWRSDVLDKTSAHPGRSAAVAVAAGYLLGGGLFSPLTARLVATGVKLALRLAVVPFLTQGIFDIAQGRALSAPDSDDSGRRKTGSGARSNSNATM